MIYLDWKLTLRQSNRRKKWHFYRKNHRIGDSYLASNLIVTVPQKLTLKFAVGKKLKSQHTLKATIKLPWHSITSGIHSGFYVQWVINWPFVLLKNGIFQNGTKMLSNGTIPKKSILKSTQSNTV